ncbi:hypothetical protein LTR64_002203 [Lithohypha guttulata]|uniref:uncharacterized protein n=1 Tax=Lithohypha guttulata TaxID=1690604 RepID=UPI00315D57E8
MGTGVQASDPVALRHKDTSDPTSQVTVLPATPSTGSAEQWNNALDHVIKGVVRIHLVCVANFDTGYAGRTCASGFVIDKKQGIILTNRHVVSPGPSWGYCTFSSQEKCNVEVIYHDPVHDFAFLHFDPSKLRYTDLREIELRSEGAKVGTEVRVIGNDSDEALSIAPAVISRIDRNTLEYTGFYHDYNTHYIQAAAVAGGGSSGSPVVNIEGHAVALQAAGTSASNINWFLPLDRVVRAFRLLQKREHIPRGTIQSKWLFKSFSHCRGLGLSSKHEEKLRRADPSSRFVLVLENIVPKSRLDGKLQVGDLLLGINGASVLSFITLEEILDTHIGQSITIEVARGENEVTVEVKVDDLHALTPRRMVKFAEAIFCDMSYMVAQCKNIPLDGTFCCYNGLLRALSSDIIIESVNNRATPNLEAFLDVIKQIDTGADVKFVYKDIKDAHRTCTAVIPLLTDLFPKFELWSRNDDYRQWTIEAIETIRTESSLDVKSGTFPSSNIIKNPDQAYIARTIVGVKAISLVYTDGTDRMLFRGHGCIVNVTQGLVLVSRALIPHGLCKVRLDIANVEVAGKIHFLHPSYNYALLKYDPSKIEVDVAAVKLAEVPVNVGDKVTMICDDPCRDRTVTETDIKSIQRYNMAQQSWPCRYRAINIEDVSTSSRIQAENDFGLLLDSCGRVVSVMLEFQGTGSSAYQLGLHASVIRPLVQKFVQGLQVGRMLGFEFSELTVATARKLGVAEHWIDSITKDQSNQALYKVARLACRPICEEIKDQTGGLLESEDILLDLDHKPVSNITGIGKFYEATHVPATVVRHNKEMTLNVPTESLEELETDKVIVFCGLHVHRPHLSVRQYVKRLPSKVYVDNNRAGSPANLYDAPRFCFITHINDVETSDLEDFVRIIQQIPDDTFFRLKVTSLELAASVTTMKNCDHYWPTQIFEIVDGEVTIRTVETATEAVEGSSA